MKRTIVVEINTDQPFANPYLERALKNAIVHYFKETLKVINVECADGTPKEAFGIGDAK